LPEARSLTFVLGGARSGKSTQAEALVTALPAPWMYVATAQAFDDEMRARIDLHRERRGAGWTTIEALLDLTEILEAMPEGRPLLLDCLTLWLSNLMFAGRDIDIETARLARALAAPRGPWVVVSNEVGLGIVPDNALARRFRDEAGRLNQRVAAVADRVLFMVAGLPMQVK
jgi:adenosylcobinamide kinase/adenosylcobinamide-phosphate guanylyltransferase